MERYNQVKMLKKLKEIGKNVLKQYIKIKEKR